MKKKKQRQIKNFLDYIKGRRWSYFTTLILVVLLDSFLNLYMAYLNKGVFRAVEMKNLSDLEHYIIPVILYIVLCCIQPFLRYLNLTTVRKMIYQIKVELFDKVEHLPMKYFDSTHSGDSIQRLTCAVDDLKTAYFTQVYCWVSSLFLLVTSILTMCFLNLEMMLVAMILSTFSFFVSEKIMYRIQKLSESAQSESGKLIALLSDIFAGFTTIKMFSGAKLIVDKYTKQNDSLSDIKLERANKSAVLDAMNYGIQIANTGIVIVIGTYMVQKGTASYDEIVAILSLQFRINSAMQGIAKNYSALQISMAGAERVFELFEQNVESHDESSNYDEIHTESIIEMRDIDFSYEAGEENVLTKFNLFVQKGECVGIVGKSGTGKSTLIKLLLRYYCQSAGDIYIGKRNIKSYTLTELRKCISYVPQMPYLFEGTILENIQYGQAGATKQEIIEAAKKSFIHDFIMLLPEQYDTIVEKNGSNFSGGEKQRIAIARAFLKDSEILLLDEPTSALDSNSEKMVIMGLERLMQNRTVLVITHNETLMKKCGRKVIVS